MHTTVATLKALGVDGRPVRKRVRSPVNGASSGK